MMALDERSWERIGPKLQSMSKLVFCQPTLDFEGVQTAASGGVQGRGAGGGGAESGPTQSTKKGY